MSDARLRDLERRAAQGEDVFDEQRRLACRRGEHDWRVAIRGGHRSVRGPHGELPTQLLWKCSGCDHEEWCCYSGDWVAFHLCGPSGTSYDQFVARRSGRSAGALG